jgi:hypothetical protein
MSVQQDPVVAPAAVEVDATAATLAVWPVETRSAAGPAVE